MSIRIEIIDRRGARVGPVVFPHPRVLRSFAEPHEVQSIHRSKGRVVIVFSKPAVELRAVAVPEQGPKEKRE